MSIAKLMERLEAMLQEALEAQTKVNVLWHNAFVMAAELAQTTGNLTGLSRLVQCVHEARTGVGTALARAILTFASNGEGVSFLKYNVEEMTFHKNKKVSEEALPALLESVSFMGQVQASEWGRWLPEDEKKPNPYKFASFLAQIKKAERPENAILLDENQKAVVAAARAEAVNRGFAEQLQ